MRRRRYQASIEYSHFAQTGWTDYYHRRPYSADYDTWREVDQRNYENGRLRAANYELATDGFLPEFSPNQEQYLKVIEPVGAAFLDRRKPESSIPYMTQSRQRTIRIELSESELGL